MFLVVQPVTNSMWSVYLARFVSANPALILIFDLNSVIVPFLANQTLYAQRSY
ncbi:hypothetical protein GYMLUDRAFT_39114, partial [Collybiopsis luxurians FD-317 M1]